MPRVTHRSSLIFVYGTLRRGGKSHDLLERLRAVYLGKGSVAGQLLDLGTFPGALKSGRPPTRVVGEIYRLPDPSEALKTLDEYEGVGPGALVTSLYRREITPVTLENGEQLSAWIYWLNHPPRLVRRIESGDYASHWKN